MGLKKANLHLIYHCVSTCNLFIYTSLLTVRKRQKAYISLLNTWGKNVIAFKQIIRQTSYKKRGNRLNLLMRRVACMYKGGRNADKQFQRPPSSVFCHNNSHFPKWKNTFTSPQTATAHYEISSKSRILSPESSPYVDKAPQGHLFRCKNLGVIFNIKYVVLVL